jgi:hypothetical protein
MHADDDQFVGVLRFQFFQVGDNVHTVDAAIRPEVEQHDFAAQVTERERLVGIQPFQRGGKVGHAGQRVLRRGLLRHNRCRRGLFLRWFFS